MKVSDLGEFALIERIKAQTQSLLPDHVHGIGDDCAVVPLGDGNVQLWSTDLLVENIHFLFDEISPLDLGHKALAVNLSDIAAMGGTPEHALLSLAVPSDLPVSWVEQFTTGFANLAQKHGVSLIGGDTTGSPGPVIINVAIVGTGRAEGVKLRSTAAPGDYLCLTGPVGDSRGGVEVLLKKLPRTNDALTLIGRHHHPLPAIEEGKFLGVRNAVHAMMDLSDGIKSDLQRLTTASHCGANIILDDLPTSETLQRWSIEQEIEAAPFAYLGGEDYELLFTVDPLHFKTLSSDFTQRFEKPLYRIGTITDTSGKIGITYKGKNWEDTGKEFRHFVSAEA